MSTAIPGQRDLASAPVPPPELAGRLGYLLKHAQLGPAELTAAALEPFGLTGRELAVLTVLASGEPACAHRAVEGRRGHGHHGARLHHPARGARGDRRGARRSPVG